MAYSYYQSGNPGWGTSQYQFGPPPAPAFQPQPTWGGMDYYRGHAGMNADPTMFEHAWNRVRDYPEGGGVSGGVGLHEARIWHRRAYGGLGELSMMSPSDIGHAAAYEAYRTWIHNSSMYEPLSGDLHRQREGLIALAVAEATRLIQFANRAWDSYSRMVLSETAAATASVLFIESREEDQYDDIPRGRSRSRTRMGSMSGSAYAGSAYAGSGYGGSMSDEFDPYSLDNTSRRRRGRSRSRHRQFPGVASSVSSIPMGGTSSAYGMQPGVMQQGSFGSAYGSYPNQYGSPGMGPGMAAGMGGSQYLNGSTYSQPTGVPMMVPSTTSSRRSRSRHRTSSVSIPGYGTSQYAPGVGQVYGATGATPAQVIMVPSTKSKKHRKHSKHRSHSISRIGY